LTLVSRPAPRFPDGRPNFGPPAGETGIWLPGDGLGIRNQLAIESDDPKAAGAFPGLKPRLSEVPFQPWARGLYEYRRNGTVNLFVLLDVHRPWRKVKLTERRAAKDYAKCMRDLVDIHYPDAETIRVVQDNLSTHSAGALYQTFPPAEARRILRRIEFHYTPKHASWLNMVEIEIGVLRGQCLARRIDDPKRLRREITAWERQRNAARSRIKWMFTTEKARAKMGRAYPDTSKES